MLRLKEWAARLDELSLRERGLMFAAAVVCLILIVHAAALQPLLRLQRSYIDRLKLNEGQLNSISEALIKSAQGSKDDPMAAKRERVRALEQRLGDSEQLLSVKRNAQASPDQVTSLLRDVLGRNRELRIVALRVLPATALSGQPAGAADGAKPASSPGKGTAPGMGAFYRHVVEIELIGNYLEVLKYLEDIEALRWKLNWSGIEFQTLNHPDIKVRASLFTVSASPSLLEL